jgi:hypothetical protein
MLQQTLFLPLPTNALNLAFAIVHLSVPLQMPATPRLNELNMNDKI